MTTASTADSTTDLSVAHLFDVAGLQAVVTGGSRGIGRMIASGLVANGADVLLVARSADTVRAAASELDSSGPGSCRGLAVDVTAADGRDRVVEEVGDTLHLLVNNAGMAVPEILGRAEAHTAAAMFDLNVTAPFQLTQALLDPLRRAATADQPGRVVMIGSIDGIRNPAAPLFSYGASKAALHALTRELAHAVAGDHITVNAIAPGMFESDMTAGVLSDPAMAQRLAATIPAGRIGSPEDIAAATIFLASRAGAYLTGAVIPVDGGVSTTHG